MAKTTSKDGLVGVIRGVRDAKPAHYLFKIDSFSTVVEERIDKLESDDFEVGDYNWRLCLYPSGNKKANGNGHISLYLVIKDTDELSSGWELNVHFKLFVFNHLEDAGRRFHALKTEWGFSQLLPLDVFNNTSNGYLFQDSWQCVSWVKEPENKCFTWKIDHFSTITVHNLYSDEFTVGKQKWKLLIYPKGTGKAKGEFLSLFLCLANSSTTPKSRLYARYKLRIKDQVSNKHFENEAGRWLSSPSDNWGFPEFKKLSDVKDLSNGFMIKDTLIVEVEFMVLSVVKELL